MAAILILFLLLAQDIVSGPHRKLFTPAGSQPAYVAKASGTSTPLTVTSTVSGHRVLLFIDSKSNTPTATLGAQSFTLDACTTTSSTSYYVCVLHINSATGSQTSVSVTTTTLDEIVEYEFTNPNTSTTIDATNACTGTSSATCTTSIAPAGSNEAMVVGFWCANNGTAITGSPVATANLITTVGNPKATVLLTASTETAAVSTNCESSTAKSGIGIAEAFF